jgi:hypothetical protein
MFTSKLESNMAGSKTMNKNSGIKGAPRSRFLVGTDIPVVRVMDGRKRFFWAVKEDSGEHRHLEPSEYELR